MAAGAVSLRLSRAEAHAAYTFLVLGSGLSERLRGVSTDEWNAGNRALDKLFKAIEEAEPQPHQRPLDVACPTCGSAAGDTCRDTSRGFTISCPPHPERRQAARVA